MLPFSPQLLVRPLTAEDLPALLPLLNRQLGKALYSLPMDEAEAAVQLWAPEPATVFPVRWQQRQLLGVWRAGQLLGLVDVAAGHDGESAAPEEHRTLGIIRFLVLPDDGAAAADVTQALLAEATIFWKSQSVTLLQAYPMRTGYPSFQLGVGLLPGDWNEQVRHLTGAEFRFTERYYCYFRPLATLMEETTPQIQVSLSLRGSTLDRRYQLFYRRTELIGEGRVIVRPAKVKETIEPIGSLVQWQIDHAWRNQRIGRWLLRRMLNDATVAGCKEMVVHVPLSRFSAINLFGQHGFEEHNYRGYTLQRPPFE